MTPEAFKTFADSVAASLRAINQCKDDQTKKDLLPYMVSDKFRQLANALRVAVPELDRRLPHPDTQGPMQTVEMLNRQKKNEDEIRKKEII